VGRGDFIADAEDSGASFDGANPDPAAGRSGNFHLLHEIFLLLEGVAVFCFNFSGHNFSSIQEINTFCYPFVDFGKQKA